MRRRNGSVVGRGGKRRGGGCDGGDGVLRGHFLWDHKVWYWCCLSDRGGRDCGRKRGCLDLGRARLRRRPCL